MITDTLKKLFVRDLKRLSREIEQYKTGETIWITSEGVSNSAGNLCLHLIGNLNTYIGSVLGGTGYVRDRDAEFALKNIDRAALLDDINKTVTVVETVLDGLADDDKAKEFPMLVLDTRTTTEYMLVHLTTHLTYHLRQVNYHRRLLDG